MPRCMNRANGERPQYLFLTTIPAHSQEKPTYLVTFLIALSISTLSYC
jgi:hypothetical protein